MSTWSLLGLDVCSAIRAIGEAGFEYLELWGEVPHAHPGWVDRQRLKDALGSYDMVLTTHSPFTDLNPASPFQPMKGSVERTLEEFVEMSADLGAKMVTFHPGTVNNEALVPQAPGTSLEALRKMTRAARGRLTVNIENQMRSTSRYQYPLASTLESLLSLLTQAGDAECTLDTGHAHASGEDLMEFAKALGGRVAEIHLNDNAGSSDDHLAPGKGTAPLKGVLEMFRHTEALVCLELNPHIYSPSEVLDASIREGVRSGDP